MRSIEHAFGKGVGVAPAPAAGFFPYGGPVGRPDDRGATGTTEVAVMGITLEEPVRGRAARRQVLAPMPAGMTGLAHPHQVRTGACSARPASSAQPVRPDRRRRAVHLTRRGRVVIVLVTLVLLVVGGFLAGRVSSQAADRSARARPATVTVHADETLWEIAARVAPHVDPRLVVEEIERLNHLSGPQVQAGQQLVVPRAS